VNITVENLTAVDKKIILEADSTDLAPKFDKALRTYAKTMNFPGFRAGKAPLALVKKRIGKEVEGEEIDKFIQDFFQNTVVPEHKPIGEPIIDNLDYTDGKLHVEFKIGIAPEFELADLSEISVDKLVHDVTDDEVQKEYEFSLRRNSEWTETEEPATADSRVVLDTVLLDENGEPTPDHDHDVTIDLAGEENKEYTASLVGKKSGETAEVTFDDNGKKSVYKVTVKKVENRSIPELNEEFFKNASRGEATNEEEFRSYLKSQIQNYFDQTADDLFHDKIAGALIEKHDFEIPESIFNDILNSNIERIKKENNDVLPETFNKDEFKEENRTNITKEAKWSFIINALMEKFPDTEITPEDVDAFFDVEAAKMGLPAEMLKNFYASQSSQLENLRMRIRTNKLFAKLAEEITAVELDKKTFEEKYSNKK
jgi:trigger factor